jgi:preprotein translocase subunit SecB
MEEMTQSIPILKMKIPPREVIQQNEVDVRQILDVTPSNILFPYQEQPITSSYTAWKTSKTNPNHFKRMFEATGKYHVKLDKSTLVQNTRQPNSERI